MKVVVLAAGYATRLYPLTRNRAKPLLEVGGKSIISHILDRVLVLDDITGVVVVSNQKFFSDFESWRSEYPTDIPIDLVNDGSTDDENRLGAVADLQLALQEVSREKAENVLVIAGDNLIDFDFAPALQFFRESGKSVILVQDMGDNVPPRCYGEVMVDEEMNITSFREKPEDPRSPLAAICCYFLDAEAGPLLDRYLEEGGNCDAPGHFLEWYVRQARVRALAFDGRYFDIGHAESLEEARRVFAARA